MLIILILMMKMRMRMKIIVDNINFDDENENENDNNSVDGFLVPFYEQSDFVYIPIKLIEQYEEIVQLMIDHNVFLECGFAKIYDVLQRRSSLSSSSALSSSSSLSSSLSGLHVQQQPQINQTRHNNNNNQEAVVEIQSIDLCTSWKYENVRGTVKMISECRDQAAVSSSTTTTTTTTATLISDSGKLLLRPLSSSSKQKLQRPYSVIHPFKINILGYKVWDRIFDWITTGGTSNINLYEYEDDDDR
jgi:hypothetical protein